MLYRVQAICGRLNGEMVQINESIIPSALSYRVLSVEYSFSRHKEKANGAVGR